MLKLPLLLLTLALLQVESAPNFLENYLEKKGMGERLISVICTLLAFFRFGSVKFSLTLSLSESKFA